MHILILIRPLPASSLVCDTWNWTMTGTPVQHWNNRVNESSFCCFIEPSGSFKHLSYGIVCAPCILSRTSPCCTVLPRCSSTRLFDIQCWLYCWGQIWMTTEFYGLIFTSHHVLPDGFQYNWYLFPWSVLRYFFLTFLMLFRLYSDSINVSNVYLKCISTTARCMEACFF